MILWFFSFGKPYGSSIKSPCFALGHTRTSPSSAFNYDMTKDETGFVGSSDSEWTIYRATTKEVLKRGKVNMKSNGERFK